MLIYFFFTLILKKYFDGTNPWSSSLSAANHPETYSPMILISSPWFFFFEVHNFFFGLIASSYILTSGEWEDIQSPWISCIRQYSFSNVRKREISIIWSYLFLFEEPKRSLAHYFHRNRLFSFIHFFFFLFFLIKRKYSKKSYFQFQFLLNFFHGLKELPIIYGLIKIWWFKFLNH